MTRAADRLVVCGRWASAQAAGLLVRSGACGADPGRRRGAGRRRRRHGLAVAQHADRRRLRRPIGTARRAAARVRLGSIRRRTEAAGARRCRLRAPTTKGSRRAPGRRRQRDRPRRWRAARWCIGSCRRCRDCAGAADRGRAAPSRPRGDGLSRGRARRHDRAGAGWCSTTRASPTCSRPDSRAEVPIVGRIARAAARPDRGLRPGRSAGRHRRRGADRRLQDQSAGARQPDDVPPPMCRQLALYRAVLAPLYPETTIRAALVWTDVPDLMEISAAMPAGCGRWPRHATSLPVKRLDALTDAVHRFDPIAGFQAILCASTTRVSMVDWQGNGRRLRSDVLKATGPGGGGFLGRVVRPLPDDRAGVGGDFQVAQRQGQDRQAQRRRESAAPPPSTASCRSRR